jgi:8-oxo-dGTP pyrophosphatase MutT (NUDIX family)
VWQWSKRQKEDGDFPKGREAKKETPVQNALRELTEETGVKLNRAHLVEPKAVFFDERLSRKRKGLCIRYFMAYVAPDWKKENNYHSFQYDTRELSESKWVKVKDALSLAPHEFKDTRKQILKNALQKIEQTRIASSLENQMSFN